MVTILTLACTELVDFDRAVAIDVVGPTSPLMQVGDTLRLVARAVSAAGSVRTDDAVTWQLIDADSGVVVLSIDSTGFITALAAGKARIQARSGTLRTGLITVTVVDPIPPVNLRFAHGQLGSWADPPRDRPGW